MRQGTGDWRQFLPVLALPRLRRGAAALAGRVPGLRAFWRRWRRPGPRAGLLPGFELTPRLEPQFAGLRARAPQLQAELAACRAFVPSHELRALTQKAAELEPLINARAALARPGLLPPWYDGDYAIFRAMRERLPPGPWDSVVLMPAGRMGGADLVAALMAKALRARGRVLILRSDGPAWERPDWYPEDIPAIDISELQACGASASRALYLLLADLQPRAIYNVNSRLAFETFWGFGARLAQQAALYACYFCADHSENGEESGYPVWFFADVLPHLTAALFDSRALADRLTERFCLPPSLAAARMRVLYTPSRVAPLPEPVAVAQIAGSPGRRPKLFWGGRFDRQKRLDFALAVAAALPEADFAFYGRAVLDRPPVLAPLPPNVQIFPAFTDHSALPLTEADGWFYTSAWDGMPSLLIELGALGMPVAASAVGGVPELITPQTGWPIAPTAGVEEAVAVLRAMLADPGARLTRARALQDLVKSRHAPERYAADLQAAAEAAG